MKCIKCQNELAELKTDDNRTVYFCSKCGGLSSPMPEQKTDTYEITVKLYGDNFYKDLNIVKSCIGRRYEQESKLWYVSATDENLARLEQIPYLKPQIEVFREASKLRSMDMDEGAALLKKDYPFLFDYQALGAYLALERKRFLIADDMGLGKTVECMPIIDRKVKEGKKVIILAPSSLLRQWRGEITRFIGYEAFLAHRKQKAIRLGAYTVEPIILTTYESFWRDVESIKIDWTNVVVIADEASKFKNRKTKIHGSMTKICQWADMFIALSGTPVENSLVNFFNILKVIKPEYMSPKEFYSHYCVWESSPYGNSIVGYQNLAEFIKRVSPLMIRRRKSDIKELPEKIVQDRFIGMSDLQKECAEGIRSFVEKGGAEFIGTLVLLREVANDPSLLEMSTSRMVNILKSDGYLPDPIPANGSNKLDELENIFDEIGDQKVLIFTMWSKMAHRIRAKVLSLTTNEGQPRNMGVRVLTGDSSPEERDATIEQFKMGEFQVLIATEIFGYGMNLQFVDTLINFDLPWNPAKLNQRIDRIHRIGATSGKLIINLISEDIEDRVKEVLDSKQNLFDKVVNGEIIEDESIRGELFKKLAKRK